MPGGFHRSNQGHKTPAIIPPLLFPEQQAGRQRLTLSVANFPLGGRFSSWIPLSLALGGGGMGAGGVGGALCHPAKCPCFSSQNMHSKNGS